MESAALGECTNNDSNLILPHAAQPQGRQVEQNGSVHKIINSGKPAVISLRLFDMVCSGI